MSNWPNNKFDIEGDNANYTCVSTGNTVGPGIKSATYFSIECKFFFIYFSVNTIYKIPFLVFLYFKNKIKQQKMCE